MGVVYDCFWYWRQEYLGYLDPYRADNPRPESHERIELNLPEVEPQVDLLDTNMQPATFGEDYFLGLSEDDAFFPEWNWSMDRHFPVELTKDWQDMATTIYT